MKKLLSIILMSFLLMACEKTDDAKPATANNERTQSVTNQSSFPPYVIKARGMSLINSGQQVDVYLGAVEANDVIILTWHTMLAGTPGVLWVESINTGSHFTIESTTVVTGWVSWVIIEN